MVEPAHLYLFTNSGTLRPTTAEEARVTHNATAGNPAGVAAAQSLGDLSHLVYVPLGEWSGEIIFLDQWTSAEGLQQFFADEQVRSGGAALFRAYDPVVWRPAEGFLSYTISRPLGQQDRIVGLVRGRVTSLETAQRVMNQVWRERIHRAHQLGLNSHDVFIRLAASPTPESLEILGVDTWTNRDGTRELYEDAAFLRAFDGVFAAEPQTWLLHRPAGDWIEW